jgi:hemoglobin
VATLFEKLGGESSVDLAVERFYDRILNDNRIKHFFENVDMHKQREHQKAFMTYAFGGAPAYNGKAMRKAHQHLVEEMGLNGSHFDAVVENLIESLQEMGVSEELIREVGAIVTDREHRNDVLNQSY